MSHQLIPTPPIQMESVHLLVKWLHFHRPVKMEWRWRANSDYAATVVFYHEFMKTSVNHSPSFFPLFSFRNFWRQKSLWSSDFFLTVSQNRLNHGGQVFHHCSMQGKKISRVFSSNFIILNDSVGQFFYTWTLHGYCPDSLIVKRTFLSNQLQL